MLLAVVILFLIGLSAVVWSTTRDGLARFECGFTQICNSGMVLKSFHVYLSIIFVVFEVELILLIFFILLNPGTLRLFRFILLAGAIYEISLGILIWE